MKKLVHKILKYIIYISISFFDFLICINHYKKIKKNIILVKLDNVGDFILWVDLAYSIRNFHKKEHITLLCNSSVKDLALNLKLFDEVITIDQSLFAKNIFYRINKIQILSQYCYQSLYHSTYSRDFIVSDCLVRLLSSRNKYGLFGDNKNQSSFLKFFSNKWYTKLFKSSEDLTHESFRNKEFLAKLNIPYIKLNHFPKFKNKNNIIKTSFKDFIVISPGAYDHKRIWPINSFVKLINLISNQYDIDIFLCGSKADKKIVDVIEKKSKIKNLQNFSGITNLLELIELIRLSKLVIANDSASIHIANAVRTYSICISGGNNFGRFVPYPEDFVYTPKTIFNKDCLKNKWECNKYHKCIEQVKEDDVFKEVKKVLDK